MKFLNATKEDLAQTLQIIAGAQAYLATLHIEQWQNGYPNEKIILNDLENNESFVVRSEDSIQIATAMFSTRTEPTYTTIEGQWLTNENAVYGVIHRMAVSEKNRGTGIAKFIFNQCEGLLKQNKIKSMRIDTHQDNTGMQGLLKNLGYHFCGIIYLENADKRLAYEKLISY